MGSGLATGSGAWSGSSMTTAFISGGISYTLPLEKLFKKLIKNMNDFSLRKDNSVFLKKYFQINKKHLDSIHSNSALEDILAEKACIL